MIPHIGSMSIAAALMAMQGVRLVTPPSKTALQLMRLDQAERRHFAKLASPEYHSALAKRERKRAKLLALS